jgi:hypothetical protein
LHDEAAAECIEAEQRRKGEYDAPRFAQRRVPDFALRRPAGRPADRSRPRRGRHAAYSRNIACSASSQLDGVRDELRNGPPASDPPAAASAPIRL